MPADAPTPPRHGFAGLMCPECGDTENTISMPLHTPNTLECRQCHSEFSPADVREAICRWRHAIRQWEAVMDWLGDLKELGD